MTPEQILARLVKPPLRCAECDCKRGGTGCRWIKSGDELTHEEYIGAALDLGPVLALVEAGQAVLDADERGQGQPFADAMGMLSAALAPFQPAPSMGQQGERA